MDNKIVGRYMRRVAHGMPVGGTQKRQFLGELKDDITRYIEENPDATPSQLERQFGSPDDIAADFISQMPYREINCKFHIRTRMFTVAVIAALLFVTIWLSTALFAMRDALENDPGYIVDNLIVEETERKTK